MPMEDEYGLGSSTSSPRCPMTSRDQPRPRTALLALLALLVGLLIPVVVAGPAAAAPTKTSICHATNSHTNPYRRITVSQSALNSHNDHYKKLAVWSYGIATKWDDVIPGASGGGSNGSSLHWDTAGIAIYNGATKTPAGSLACRGMSTKEYYDSEIAAGVPQADVLADLNSQKANEDAALLAALGGTFTAGTSVSWRRSMPRPSRRPRSPARPARCAAA
jgi:hypothetical protein